MSHSRKRRSAKPDWRAPSRHQPSADDDVFYVTVRRALAKHPLHLLALASLFISWATPEPTKRSLEGLIDGLAARRCRETTALLAIFAELLLDDEPLRERCRQEVSTRDDRLPKWIVGLSHVEVRGAMRRTDVLGDGDELLIGLRLAGAELTVGAFLDHNFLSVVTDLNLLTDPIGRVLARARENANPGAVFADMDPADARSWFEGGMSRGTWLPRSNGRRDSLPLARWLVAQLPDGGTAYEKPEWDDALLDSFFASPVGASFADVAYRDILLELCDTGCGDATRWSATRLAAILRQPFRDEYGPLEIALDVPALLRAFVPFAHAHSGIRQDLTGDAITTIDGLSLRYKRSLLDDALKDDELESWHTYPDRAS